MNDDTDKLRTVSVPEAGRIFDLAKNAAYAAAKRGDIPVIRIGGRLRVPVVALERMLADAGARTEQPKVA
jgi:Helix-turn-helix domain